MTITGGSALSKDEIDRMVQDAEVHADEDRQRREAAETRNQAETLVYQTEKFISENDDKLPSDIKEKVQAAVGELKTALEGDDTEAIKAASEKVATESQQLGQALYAQQQSEGGAAGAAGAAGDAGPADGADDVVDAEIVDDDKKE
jgi:molecular chaperone DnaK